jgi:3-deoxy-manno-octulosonate cytidylyltransferase (CMP-KDO synthetase)
MIQGDEPMVLPTTLEDLVKGLLGEETIQVANLMAAIASRDEQDDPNEVKVVFDLEHHALYFSREPIPSWKKTSATVPMFKQLGLIAFKRDFLIEYSELSPTTLEIIESVDMLRVLEHGYQIKMILSEGETYSVDTPEDLQRVVTAMQNDPLLELYK